MEVKRTLLLYALILVSTAALAIPAGAQNLWDVTWDCYDVPGSDVVDEDDPSNNKYNPTAYNWDMGKVSPRNPSTQVILGAAGNVRPEPQEGEVRVYDRTNGAPRTFYRVRLDPESTAGITLEVRMDPKYAALNSQIVLRIASSRGVVQIAWWYTQILLNKGSSPSGNLLATGVTSAYHTYRLTEDASGWKFYFDGTLKASGTVAPYSTETPDDRNEVGFGELDPSANKMCEFYVDYAYIDIDAGGGYAPGAANGPLAITAAPYLKKGPMWSSTSPDSARFTWDTWTASDTKVYYRVYGTEDWSSRSNSDSVLHHDISITNLVGGTLYEYYVESSDGTNTLRSDIKNFLPMAQVRILFGYAYGPRRESLGDGSYRFTWAATAEADSYLYYRPLGSSTWQEYYDPTMIPRFDPNDNNTRHVVTLSGFIPGTTYEWYARSTHPEWGQGQTGVSTFAHDFVITEGPEALTNNGNCNITWQTSLNGTERVYYRQFGTGEWSQVDDAQAGTLHGVQLTGLLTPAQYEYKVESTCLVAGFGTVTSDVKTFETYDHNLVGGNLLTNSGFEDGVLTPWVGFGGLFTVARPSPGYDSAEPHSGEWRLYCGRQAELDPGGAYQRITDIPAGSQNLYASAWILTHEISYNPSVSAYGYNWTEYWATHVSDFIRIGIDPTGGTDPASTSIVWSAPVYSHMKGHPYVPVGVSAALDGSTTATVFIRGLDKHSGWKQHILCVDDVWAGVTPGQPIQNLIVTENDPMSVTFSWTTPLATSSMVQYAWDDSPNPNWFAYDDHLTTNHSITITNMFMPDEPHKFRVQSISAMGLGVSDPPLATFQTSPNTELANGNFEAPDLAWDQDLGFGFAAIPWHKFGATTGTGGMSGVARDGTYQMHGFTSTSPTHALVFEEGYNTADNYGGVYQRVKVGSQNAGETYMGVAKVLSFAYGNPYDVGNRIGIDPTGGTDADSSSVIWGPWVSTNGRWSGQIDLLTGLTVPNAICGVIAGGEDPASWDGYVTMFLQTEHRWGAPLNLTMFDDVTLAKVPAETSLSNALCCLQPGWPVDLGGGADDPGLLVTKVESIYEYTYGAEVPYCWIQDDERVNGIKVCIDRIDNASAITRGDRVRVRGNTNVRSLFGPDWADAEILALQVDIKSSGNLDPVPLDMTNKALCGGGKGIRRGATDATGTNNVGLLVKTTGRVTYADQTLTARWYFVIDDGSALVSPLQNAFEPSAAGIKVWPEFYGWPPSVGEYVSVTGVGCLEVYDPTPIRIGDFDLPNGSGDEVLLRTIRVRDFNDIQVIPEP